MEILDANVNLPLLEQALARFGDGPEHHAHYFLCEQEDGYTAHLIVDGAGGERTLLGLYDKDLAEWTLHAEPLCPAPERCAFLHDAAVHLLAQGAKKVRAEVRPELRAELIAYAKASRKIRVGAVNYALTWPVFDLGAWNGETLSGSAWKDLRYAVHAFKTHYPNYRIAHPRDVDAAAMLKLVKVWKKTRAKRHEQTPTGLYENAIKTGFAGWDESRVIIVDEKPVAITAGFKLTHTKPQYYSAIGIYDQSYTRLGEFANWDDLCNLKRLGYTHVDFGGGDATLNTFKMKFRPTSTYVTEIFSLLSPKAGKKQTIKKK